MSYRDPPPEYVIILVVSVMGRGHHKTYTHTHTHTRQEYLRHTRFWTLPISHRGPGFHFCAHYHIHHHFLSHNAGNVSSCWVDECWDSASVDLSFLKCTHTLASPHFPRRVISERHHYGENWWLRETYLPIYAQHHRLWHVSKWYCHSKSSDLPMTSQTSALHDNLCRFPSSGENHHTPRTAYKRRKSMRYEAWHNLSK